ncbi:MAG TPA: cobalamin-independent methionine synthase II family protein [Steroidobacteraceae bacterium]|nr:cobalamin-independent methionine synthase II family protein [Steroidobacteraceae bacterium]
MQRSTDRILVTHAGRLSSGMEGYEAAERDFLSGRLTDHSAFETLLDQAVRGVVRDQIAVGIDVVSDGELARRRGFAYYKGRLTGIEERECGPGEVGATIFKTRERDKFRGYYADADRARAAVARPRRIVCTGPLRHLDLSVLQSEIARFKSALGESGREGFFPVIAPGWLDHFIFNEYYPSDEAFVHALAEVMEPEYRAVVDAGLILQVDDPGLPDAWTTFFPEPTLEAYRAYARVRVDALNHALRGIPEDRVRYHLCWGSWNGPHTEDIAFRSIVDLMLDVRAQGYSFEAGNVRHEHEWKIWRDVKLPPGKILIPGVVSHRTETVEHPEVVADRICQFAQLVGRENVMAGTDCGMGLGRVHHEVGWAKLAALRQGADLASRRLWA